MIDLYGKEVISLVDEVKSPGEYTVRMDVADLPAAASINLVIFNHLSQRVEGLVNGHQTAGKHQIIWNTQNLPSGVYFFRLSSTVNCQPSTGKMVKIRK